MATESRTCGTGGWAGPMAGDPSNVFGLTATSKFGGIELNWDLPTLNPFAVAHTRLYRSTLPVFSTAPIPLIVGGNRYFDVHNEDDLGTYYYWIQAVSINGTVGEIFGPSSAAAMPSIERTIELLSGKVDSSLLAQSLRTEIARIGTLATNLEGESTARSLFNTAMSQALSAVQGDVIAAKTLIESEVNNRSTNYEALLTSLNLMAAGVANNAAAIAEQDVVYANELSALASQVTALTATVGQGNAATTAALEEERVVRANQDSALAQQITTAQTSLGNNLAAVQQSLETEITTVNEKVTQIGARYTVKVNVNGLVGGFGIYNDGTTIDAGFDVDTFFIGKGSSIKKPFIVTNGVVWIDGAVINQLQANQINTNGLIVRDNAGNPLFGVGNPLDFSNIGGSTKPANGATRNVFKGTWASSVSYVVGDAVLDGAGYGWSCILNHTSGPSALTPTYPASSNTHWTLYAVRGGSSLIPVLSNDSHTFPADSSGVVAAGSYTGSGTNLTVSEGSEELIYDAVGTANGTWKVTATGSNITPGAITDGGSHAVVANHSAMLSAQDLASVTYAITGKTKAGVAFTLNKVQSFTKAKSGVNGASGLNSAVLFIYQRAATAPALPSAAVTYTFATGAVTGLTNGWSSTIPTGTLPLYVSVATASNSAATDTIANTEWATAVILAKDGVDGSAGANTATVYLFQRTATNTAPAKPSATVTYTFATAVAAGLNNGWSQTMPATGGSFRWVTTATALSTGTTDTLPTTEWATVSLLAEDGVDGVDGAAGAAATSYWLTTSSPAIQKSLAGVYTPSSVSVSIYSVTGTAAPVAYAGRFIIATSTDGTNFTTEATSTVNESTRSYVVPANIKLIRVRAYLAGGVTTLLDELTMTVVADGATGAQGNQGVQGNQGAQGVQGVQGPQGAQGLTGPQGATGQRGTVQLARSITGTTWVDAEANAALSANGSGGPISGDLVTLYNLNSTPPFSQAKVYTSGWQVLAAYFNGSVLVDGTVVSQKIDTRGLSIKDANGNIILAAGTSLPASYAPALGTNLVYNADFSNSADGWELSTQHLISRDIAGVNLNTEWYLAPYTGQGTNVFYARQPGRLGNPAAYIDHVSAPIPVQSGMRYIGSAFTGAHRCNVTVFMYFYGYNAQGVEVITGNSEFPASSLNAGTHAGGKTLAGYKRCSSPGTAPPNTAFARLVIRKNDTHPDPAGQPGLYGDSYVFFGQCMVEQVGGLATEPAPWSPGASFDATSLRASNRITAANASTYIADLAVDTLQIAGDAVTVPRVFNDSQITVGQNGVTKVILSKAIILRNPGKTLVFWSGEQGYSTGGNNFFVVIKLNGVEIGRTRGGNAQQDAPKCFAFGDSAGGLQSITVEWQASNGMEIKSQNLIVMGAQR